MRAVGGTVSDATRRTSGLEVAQSKSEQAAVACKPTEAHHRKWGKNSMANQGAEFATRTRAALRIFDSNVDPEAITEVMGFSGDHQHRMGDLIGSSHEHRYKNNMWLSDSKAPREATLDVHLNELLSRLESKKAYIRSLAEHATVDFYCTIFWNIGFQLKAQTLTRIAALGADFGVAVYNIDVETVDSDTSPITDGR